MAVPVAPRIRAHVLSKGKVGVFFKAVSGATTYRLYTGGTSRTAAETTGVNEQQTVTISATGGNFKITYSGQETADIAWNATAAAVRSALEALSNIAVGDVAVTGSAGGPYTIEFTGLLARTNVGQVTCTDTLSGGAGTATPATTVAGVAAADLDIVDGEVRDLAVGTAGYFAVRAANAEGESAISNIVALANRDYDAIFGP